MVVLLLSRAVIDALSALLLAALFTLLLPMGRSPSGWYAQIEALGKGLGSGASALLILLMALVVCKGGLAPLLSALRGRLIDTWTLLISLKVFEKELTKAVPQRMEAHSQGSNVAVNYLVPKIVMGTILPSLELLTEVVVVCVLLSVLLVLEPLATAVIIAALLTAIGVASGLSLFLGGIRGERRGSSQILMQRWVTDSVACLREIHLYQRLHAVLGRYRPVAKRFARSTARERTLMDIQSPLMELFFLLVLAASVAITSESIWHADLHSLALFSAVGLRLVPGFRRIVLSLQTIRFSRPFFEELASNERPFEVHVDTELSTVQSQDVLLCETLQYIYPQTSQAVIRNLNLRIHHGEWVGLVGESGAGKSTLVDLLIGELKPHHGRIQVFNKQSKHRAIGYAGAFTTLIPGTLRDNVGFLGERCTDQHLLEALTITGIMPLVSRLPLGLDTPVEAFEQRISSGERQRIGLARAVIHAQVLLILDEATASLDQLTEDRFLRSLRSARPDLAVLLITHRLSALHHTDRDLQMINGALNEFTPAPSQSIP